MEPSVQGLKLAHSAGAAAPAGAEVAVAPPVAGVAVAEAVLEYNALHSATPASPAATGPKHPSRYGGVSCAW